MASFKLHLEVQVHLVENGEKGKNIPGGENSLSNGLEAECAWGSGVGCRRDGQKLRVARAGGAPAGAWFHAFPQCLGGFASRT